MEKATTRPARRPHALRLLKARIAAGYTSGKTAAEARGWPPSTYSADEAGRRLPSPDRVSLYAVAFGVPPAWLQGEIAEDDLSDEAARARTLEAMSVADIRVAFAEKGGNPPSTVGAGERLTKARLDANFPTVRTAAEHFGWVLPTTYAHENGTARYGSAAAHRYARAYGADPAWLMTGAAGPCPPGRTPADWPTGGPRGSREDVAALAARHPFFDQVEAKPTATAPVGSRWGADRTVVIARKVPPGGRIRIGDRLIVNRQASASGLYAGAMGRAGARVFFLQEGEERPEATLGLIEAVVVAPSWLEG